MIQSVIFNKQYYNIDDATKFIMQHPDLKIIKSPHITENYIRFRQIDPDYKKYNYYTKNITDGVSFIIGYKK